MLRRRLCTDLFYVKTVVKPEKVYQYPSVICVGYLVTMPRENASIGSDVVYCPYSF